MTNFKVSLICLVLAVNYAQSISQKHWWEKLNIVDNNNKTPQMETKSVNLKPKVKVDGKPKYLKNISQKQGDAKHGGYSFFDQFYEINHQMIHNQAPRPVANHYPEPVLINQPMQYPQPVEVFEPVQYPQPIYINHQNPVIEPYVVNEPVLLAEPFIIPEPVVVSEPVFVNQPVVVNEPVIVSEPVVVSEPVFVNQPVVVNKPVIVSEPTVPFTIQQPVLSHTGEIIIENTLGGVNFDCSYLPSGHFRDNHFCDVYHACVHGFHRKTYTCPIVGKRTYFDEITQR